MSQARMNKLGWIYGSMIAGAFTLAGCNDPPSAVQVGNTYIGVQAQASSTPTVCDPFGSPEIGQPVNGVHGKAFYWAPWWDPVTSTACETNDPGTVARVGPNNVAGYIAQGAPIDVDLFLNQLNVPTRPFDMGFQTQDGLILQTPKGNTMYEYFALQMESTIKIGSRDSAGYYQFAILADDGAVMQMDDHGTFRTVVNNDGTHASKFRCANEAVYFDSSTRLPVKINYYQGPRYHIAMMLMWRKVADASAASLVETECSSSGGNTYYFNPNVSPSAPTAKYTAMIGRGWKVLSPDNYLLPAAQVGSNPCTQTCFTDSYQNPSWNTFTLSKQNVDPASIKVSLSGANFTSFTFDPVTNTVNVWGFFPGSGDIKIDFCVTPVGNDTPATVGGGAVGV